MTSPAAAALEMAGPTRRSLALSSVWLLLAKGLQMGAGFFFWVIAAHSASVTTVGVAAACVSGVMLCTQVGVLGTGSAVIVALARGDAPQRVLDTAFSVLGVASLLTAGGYLFITGTWGTDELRAAQTLGFLLLFVGATLLGTMVICLDQASIALHRSDGAATRYAVGGAVTLVCVVGTWLSGRQVGVTLLVACWALGSLCSVIVGMVQLSRWAGYRYRPHFGRDRVRGVLRVGVPNQLLTASERMTPMLVPIILAHFASPATTAYWYPAWMMAWVAFNAPISVGMVQFNLIAGDPARVRKLLQQGMVWSLLLGGGLALGAAVGADALLSLLGGRYADASAGALRILALGVLPFMVLQAYNAACRALGRLPEALVLGGGIMAAVVVGTAVVGPHGTTATAIMWVATSSAAALVALLRLPSIVRSGSSR